ncbi:MAG: TonB-dependent receptor plug domain-containing protein [Calditrichaeota bacterium]|nr:TonB-dependent receptor plug domain-containing protein [Calditrichota bacterium]
MRYKIQRLLSKQKIIISLLFIAIATQAVPTFAQIPLPPVPPPPDSLTKQTRTDSLPAPPAKPRLVFPNDTLAQVPFQILNHHSLQSIFAEDISDWFKLVNSIYIFDPAAAGQQTYFSFRGTNPRQSKVFLDYRPFYDPMSGEADLTLLPMEFMESVDAKNSNEMLLFFSDAETIGLRTTPFRGREPYSQIYHHKAPRGFSDVDFRFGQQVSHKANVMVGGHIKSNDGRNGAYLYEHQNLRARVNFLFSQKWRLQYSVINHSLNRKLPGYFVNDEFAAPSAKQKLTRTDHTVNFFGRMFGAQAENFRGALYFSNQYTKLTDVEVDKKDIDRSRYAGTNFTFRLGNGSYSASLDGDAEFTDANAADFGEKKQSKVGGFLRQSWRPNEKWATNFAAGLRWQNDFSPRFSGSFSQIFSPDSSWEFSLRGSRGVRFPFLAELFAGSPVRGNPSLAPETVNELALQTNFSLTGSAHFLATGFFKQIENEIQYQFSDSSAFIAANSDAYQFFGADLGAEIFFFHNFKFQSMAMLLEKCRTNHLPKISAVTALEYWNQFFQGDLRVLARIQGQYWGERTSEVFHPYQAIKLSKKLDPALVLNFFANLKFGKLQFYFLLENILDEKYEIIYGYPMNPRSFHYGIRWEFWN